MTVSNINDCIREICNFPKIYREKNLSPINIYNQLRYERYFSDITLESILDFLVKNPELIDDWLLFSVDKRYTPTWGINEKKENYELFYCTEKCQKITKVLIKDKFFVVSLFIIFQMEELRLSPNNKNEI